jgi:hypothetical protein
MTALTNYRICESCPQKAESAAHILCDRGAIASQLLLANKHETSYYTTAGARQLSAKLQQRSGVLWEVQAMVA